MVRYLHSILLAGLLAGVLALGLGVGAAATAPMEPFVPPKAPTEPSDPETNGEMYGWGTGGASLVYDRSVWYVREKKTRGINSGEWQSETYNEHGDIVGRAYSSGKKLHFRHCYTPDGALLSDASQSCVYDEQGRLIDYTNLVDDIWMGGPIRYHFTYRYGTDAEGRTYGEKVDADTGLPLLRTTFDAQDRPIQIVDLDKNGNATDDGVQYTYDAAGRLTKREIWGRNTCTWSYDDAGHLIAYTDTPSWGEPVRVRYDYDDRGCFLGAYYGDSTTPRTTFHYDAQGRLISWERDEYSCRYTYNEKGQLLRATSEDGRWQEFSYDAEGRTASIRSDSAETTYRYARYGSFLDVDESDWYAPYIQSMADKGLLKGMEDGTFSPNANMTVAEAITLAVRMAADEGSILIGQRRTICRGSTPTTTRRSPGLSLPSSSRQCIAAVRQCRKRCSRSTPCRTAPSPMWRWTMRTRRTSTCSTVWASWRAAMRRTTLRQTARSSVARWQQSPAVCSTRAARASLSHDKLFITLI